MHDATIPPARVSVERVVLREQVKEILLQRILRSELQAGDRLVETRIAQELGTSQAPVREALRDLELLGLVESEPFRGSRVREVTPEALLQVFPVRIALEALAAREAALRLEGDVSLLEVELERMLSAALSGDTRAQLAHDIAFHRAVVAGSGNQMLLRAWASLGIELPTAVAIYWTYWDPVELVDFHRPIVEAIRARDPRRASAEARHHVRRTERVVQRRRSEKR
jgi:DNA-binding GntR family transcriptional regulator